MIDPKTYAEAVASVYEHMKQTSVPQEVREVAIATYCQRLADSSPLEGESLHKLLSGRKVTVAPGGTYIVPGASYISPANVADEKAS